MGDAGAPGVGDNCCTHRDMDSVQESSRCKQTKPSLWPTRPAGRIRDHQARSRVRGAQPGARMVCPTCYRDSLPGRESQKDGLGTVKREIARKGSPQPEAVPRTRHTHPTDTLVGRTHRERPLTAVSSTQSAVGKWQHSANPVRSTQHRKEVTPHMHTPATTHPQDRHAQWKSAPAPTLGEPTRPAHPSPGQSSRTGSGSGSGSGSTLDAGRPGPPHRQHHRRFHCRCRFRCGRDRAGTPAPSAPAPVGDAPTPATPASVAASPNPNRRCTLLRQHTGPQPLTTPSPPRPNRDRHGAPARRQTPATPAHRSVAGCLHPNRNGTPTRRRNPSPPLAAPSLTG